MQAAGNLVGRVVEFTAGMQGGHDQFQGRNLFRGMHIHRNTPSVIFNRYRVVFVNRHPYSFTVAGQGFVNTVVDNFPDEMVKSFNCGIAYIHGRSFSDGLETVQYFYLIGIIALFFFCHAHILCWWGRECLGIIYNCIGMTMLIKPLSSSDFIRQGLFSEFI